MFGSARGRLHVREVQGLRASGSTCHCYNTMHTLILCSMTSERRHAMLSSSGRYKVAPLQSENDVQKCTCLPARQDMCSWCCEPHGGWHHGCSDLQQQWHTKFLLPCSAGCHSGCRRKSVTTDCMAPRQTIRTRNTFPPLLVRSTAVSLHHT